jgi:hypothetical protein
VIIKVSTVAIGQLYREKRRVDEAPITLSIPAKRAV